MKQDELAVAAVVRLAGGGPDMTVTHLTDGIATVGWFGNDGLYHEHNFPVVVLVPAPAAR